MENEIKNDTYYENLSLEEALKERETCFNEKGEVINEEKLNAVLRNGKLFSYLFSDEKLVKNAQQDINLSLKSASEKFLGKVFPPSWYWKMPDYYYPGLYIENNPDSNIDPLFDSLSDQGKIRQTTTRNEAVLNDCGWKREKYESSEYFNDSFPNIKIVFTKDRNLVSIIKFNPATHEETINMTLPFSLVCGIFLKCRELEYDKPWQLRAHDYQDNYPSLFEEDHHIVRDPETHEIIDSGDWKPEEE